MATNKWLSDLRVLKANTDTLREHLRDGNVEAYDNDTLQTLISKVPQLAPIESSDKWKPDPLWKFPDPNGSGELKTIDEIFDEDSMASSYTYRGVYQIIGEHDSIDLKEQMQKRTSADTFVLSDGTVYENITATTLVHTWDKSKDIIDSKGRAMRYVRVYSNTALNYLIGFANTVIWAVHKMGTALSNSYTGYSNGYDCHAMNAPIECARIIGISGMDSYLYNIKKIIWENTTIGTSSTNGSYFYKLRELELDSRISKITGTSTYSNAKMFGNATIDYFVAPESLTSFEVTNNINTFYFIVGDFSKCNKLTTFKLQNSNPVLQKIILPNSVTTLNITGGTYCVREFDVPTSVTSLSLTSWYALEELTIPESVQTLSVSSMYGLRRVNIPYNYNLTGLSLNTSYYLEHDSIVNMLENLANLTGSTAKTLSIGSTNLAKLTDEEKAIATNKNWTLS